MIQAATGSIIKRRVVHAREVRPRSHLTEAIRCGGPILLLGFLTLGFLAPVLLSPADEVIASPDIGGYFLHIHDYIRAEFLSGRLPLWDPYNCAGMPFAANPQCTVFYPPSWLYLLMPVPEAHKWMVATHLFLAATTMYLFLRRVGLQRGIAVAACLPWIFGSYAMANVAVGHLTMLFTAAWLPLVLYCAHRALSGDGMRWFFWAGMVLGVQLLAGEPQNSYYTLLLLILYAFVMTLWPEDGTVDARQGAAISQSSQSRGMPAGRRAWTRWTRLAGGLALAGTVAATISAIQLLPTLELLIHSDRSGNTYDFAANRSLPPASLIGLIVPWSTDLRGLQTIVYGRPVYADLNWEFACYAGILTLVLAALSLRVRGKPALRVAWIAMPLSLLFMLGGHTPLYRVLLTILPGLNLFRIPARAEVIALWAIAVMAGFGLQWLSLAGERWAGRWRVSATAGLILLLAALFIPVGFLGAVKLVPDPVEWWKPRYETVTLFDPALGRPVLLVLATLALVWVARWLPTRAKVLVVGAFIALDLFVSRPAIPLVRYAPEEQEGFQFLAASRQAARSEGLFRVDCAPAHASANLALQARAENVNGYWPLTLKRFYRYVHWMRGQEPGRERFQLHDELYTTATPFLRLLNVRTASSNRPGSAGPDTIVEDPHPLPRAWLVDRAEVIPEEQAVLERLRDPAFDPAGLVLLESAPRGPLAPGEQSAGRCTAAQPDPGSLVIEAQCTRDAYLVISQIFYPGWRTTVDGVPVRLERADYLISALPLSAGSHHVTLRYEPLSFSIGALVTTMAVLLAIGVAGSAYWWPPRSRQPVGS